MNTKKIDKIIECMKVFIRMDRDINNKVTLKEVDEMFDELRILLLKEKENENS